MLDYQERLDPILSALEEANHAVRGTGELRGHLRVGAALSFAMQEVVPRLPAFLEPHPKLRIDFVTADKRQNLVGDGIDVALRFGRLPDSTMIAKKLADSRRVVSASPAYLERCGTPQTPADLAQHDSILVPSSATAAGWTFARAGKRTSVRVDGRLAFSTSFLGCRAELESGTLVELLPEWSLGSVEVNAVPPGNHRAKASARAFVEYLADSFSG